MKLRISLIIIAISICAMTGLGQTLGENNTVTPQTPPASSTTTKIEVAYDRFEDKTRVSLLMPITSSSDSTLHLLVLDSSKGQSYTPSGYVGFALLSEQNDLFADSNSTLYLLADGKRFELETKLSSKGTRLALLPYLKFQSIAGAKKVEGRLGSTEFELNEQQMEALRAYLGRVTVKVDPDRIYKRNEVTEAARIISRPEADYTTEVRRSLVSGTVTLRVVLSYTGKVTDVEVVHGLSDGLTEKAVEAARKIRFTPATKSGRPVSVSLLVEYNFNPY
jgi:TonB family protein